MAKVEEIEEGRYKVTFTFLWLFKSSYIAIELKNREYKENSEITPKMNEKGEIYSYRDDVVKEIEDYKRRKEYNL